MTLELVRDALGWCAVINTALLLVYWLVLLSARELIYRIHGKWFKFPAEEFDAIHYKNMTFFKTCVFLFNIVPYLALRIVM